MYIYPEFETWEMSVKYLIVMLDDFRWCLLAGIQNSVWNVTSTFKSQSTYMNSEELVPKGGTPDLVTLEMLGL